MADEALTAGAVARRLGVAVTTLRTWHQRYGLGPSRHVPGQHRRYTREDMDRLQVMRRLTAQGVAPAEAAAWARRVPVPMDVSTPVPPLAGGLSARSQADYEAPAGDDPAGDGQERGGGEDAGWVDAPARDRPGPHAAHPGLDAGDPAGGNLDAGNLDAPNPGEPGLAHSGWRDSDPEHPNQPKSDLGRPGQHDAGLDQPDQPDQPSQRDGARDTTFTRAGERRARPVVDAVWPELTDRLFVARDGGGSSIRTGRSGPAARGLARAAMRLDGPALRDILEMTVTDRGVVAAWEEVIKPVLIGIGERYAATKRFIEVEHLISRGVTEVLGSVTRPPSTQLPRVLLAAADEEQHTLPLEALAAALAQAGVPSRLLGARVPPQALGDAVARTGPAAVVLWSHLPSTGDPEQWVRLLSGPHRPVLAAAAGPGWPVHELPEGVTPLGNLPEAVRLVSVAAAPAGWTH